MSGRHQPEAGVDSPGALAAAGIGDAPGPEAWAEPGYGQDLDRIGVERAFGVSPQLTSETIPPCPVRSGITGQPCLLLDGHDQDSPTRFHKYAPPLPDSEYRVEADVTGYTVGRPDDEGRFAWRGGPHPEDRATARYAAMLLNSGIDPDELDEMLRPEVCDDCGANVYGAELDPSGRCAGCQS